MPYRNIRLVALTNDRAQLIAHEARVDDVEAAEALTALYLARGHIVRWLNDDDGSYVERRETPVSA